MDSAHFFTYLTILLKISNHLALTLPCKRALLGKHIATLTYCLLAPNDTEEQVSYMNAQSELELTTISD